MSQLDQEQIQPPRTEAEMTPQAIAWQRGRRNLTRNGVGSSGAGSPWSGPEYVH
jgi:hypothetical protein